MVYSVGAVERAMTIHQPPCMPCMAAKPGSRSPTSSGSAPGACGAGARDLSSSGCRACSIAAAAPRRLDGSRWANCSGCLRLYRERYQGFNVRHFHQLARRDHGVTFSYTLVKTALQGAGLVPKGRARGRHRRRREPRPCFGELLHLDGSRHRWLALVPEAWHTLLVIVDDATKHVLYAQLVEGGESTRAIMTALWAVFAPHGLPGALYTDRAHWAVHTPTSGSAPDRTRLTQVGRALPASGSSISSAIRPQARGRSERVNRTLQDRLVNELRLAGIRTVTAANRYLTDRFLPAYQRHVRPAPDGPGLGLCASDPGAPRAHPLPSKRRASWPGTIRSPLDRVGLQIAKQRGRRTCAGLPVLVRRHLDGRHSVWWGRRCLGRYDAAGRPLTLRPATVSA